MSYAHDDAMREIGKAAKAFIRTEQDKADALTKIATSIEKLSNVLVKRLDPKP